MVYHNPHINAYNPLYIYIYPKQPGVFVVVYVMQSCFETGSEHSTLLRLNQEVQTGWRPRQKQQKSH